MPQTNTRQKENLDLGLVYRNESSLARKADIRQYPTGADRSAGRQTQQIRSQVMARQGHSSERTQQAGSQGRPQLNRQRESSSGARRNPYLADYGQGTRSASYGSGKKPRRGQDELDLIWGEEVEHPIPRRNVQGRTQVPRTQGSGNVYESSRGQRRQSAPADRYPQGGFRESAPAGYHTRREARESAAAGYRAQGSARQTSTVSRSAQSYASQQMKRSMVEERAGALAGEQRRRLAQARRRKEMMRRKMILGGAEVLAVICIAVLVYQVFLKKDNQPVNLPAANQQENLGQTPIQTTEPEMVQGISAEVYARHPKWEEDFLTPNEYSRPGDPLKEVKNIFVHYTANPNTSAKQNRSYFEQQKDTHERSVSAHFIIGYDGEILQIVPMDEIAYAVMTRNEDSISIECCYKAENGQFTQETYDSLISLLSWLTEAYNLDSEDILRHYDTGGKKCPLYYTEHEDAWLKLKKDVADYTL